MSDSLPSSTPGPTPSGYQRTHGGGLLWQPPTVESLQALLPQYEIEALIGRGGMGAVYKGKQRALDRPVAIKLLPPTPEDDEANFTERFKNEARIMAKLDHPAIVPVYDFGETSEGQLYFVMAFIDGTDIQHMIESQGRLPAEHALAITAHVCDALAYAHDHGVIHRDIKPSNILITMEGQVKVADFGLAKVEDAGTSGLTKTGQAMGTPDFVAPEALMQGIHTDGRADLYSVGVMLYQMLTGNIPRGVFTMPSVMLPGTDPRFDAIIAKAMKYDREERYPSAQDVRADLDLILTVPLVQADSPGTAAIPVGSHPIHGSSASAQGGHNNVVAKSKTPLFASIGVLAALTAGVFFMMNGKSSDKPSPPSPPAVTSALSPTPPSDTHPTDATKPEPPNAQPPQAGPRPLAMEGNDPSSPHPPRLMGNRPPPGEGKGPPGKGPPGMRPPEGARPKPGGLPPGKWMDLFTPGEKLSLRAAWKDDWIVNGTSIFMPKLGPGPQRDLAIRFTVKGSDIGISPDPSPVSLWLRNDGEGAYVFRVRRDGALEHVYTSPAGAKNPNPKPFHTLHVAREKRVYEPDKLYTFEIAAFGTKLTGRCDGKLFAYFDNDEVPEGNPLIVAYIPMRDIQGLNLDGLTEAEARTLLDIGEDGKDLRTPVVKQQKQPPAFAAIPALAELHEQFTKLQSERVTAPFDNDLAKLNSNYLGGLEREIGKAKAEGNLDGVLNIEAEKKLITANKMPPAEDDKISGSHRNLRGIYRTEHAKLEATRAANLKALIGPLDARLRSLEADLTKKDKLADAKAVRSYREDLAKTNDAEPTASVVEPNPKPAAAPAPPLKPGQLKDGYTNSLGMKFIAVKSTDVLFCIHETRFQDYAAFAASAPGVDSGWKRLNKEGVPFGDKDDHPAMGISWNEAQKFCAWLSAKEGRTYRLPTDREWSIAVGIGREERVTSKTTPESLSGKLTTEYPWGNKWPPPKDSGNYADKSQRDKFPTQQFIEGYEDGFATSAPVMSFKPNKQGLFDMGGNAWEWVEDWWNGEKTRRVMRGGSFSDRERTTMLSSKRIHNDPNDRGGLNGFRCVLVP